MDKQARSDATELCGAIDAALRIAEAIGDTLVSALLTEAREAAACEDAPASS